MVNNKIKLSFVAPVSSYSGYGERARDLINGILDHSETLGVLQVFDTPWGSTSRDALPKDSAIRKYIQPIGHSASKNLHEDCDVLIQITLPQQFKRQNGVFNVGITAGIETKEANNKLAGIGIKAMDLTFFSSSVVREKFVTLDFLPDKRLKVLPEGLDPDIFKPEYSGTFDGHFEDEKLVLCAGMWENTQLGLHRKSITESIIHFCDYFTIEDGYGLVLKVSQGSSGTMDRMNCERTIKMIKSQYDNRDLLPNIYLVHGNLSKTELNDLYTHPKMKLFWSMSKGEGFGRHLLEACFAHLPVLSPDTGAHRDFITSKFPLMRGDYEKVPSMTALVDKYGRDAEWYVPNLTKVTLKNTIENSEVARDKLQSTFEKIRSEYSLEAMVNKLERSLVECLVKQ